MNKTCLFAIGGVLIVTIVVTIWFFFPRSATAPVENTAEQSLVGGNSSTTPDSETTQTPANTSTSLDNTFLKLPPIENGDTIASWNFKGAYTGNPELVAKAESEIKRLSDLIGKGTFTDTTLYVSIANNYALLGDGKKEYDYLGHAIEIGGNTSGLPWHNLGVLMERLGALQTARIAYEKATIVQPVLKEWHYAYLIFLTARMSDYTIGIEKAFAEAKKNIVQDADILQIYSEWKRS